MAELRPGSFERVRELCRKLKPIVGPKMDQLFQAYCAEDVEGKKQVEAYLQVLEGKYLAAQLDDVSTNLVPPPQEQAAGDYVLGTVQYAGRPLYEFGLREDEWIQHVGIFGRTGAGKTNLGFQIFRQLLAHGKPVLVFDWKRNYRDLLVFPEFQDVEVYTVGRDVAPFRFNPLIPPRGINPKTWLKKLIEVVAHAYCLGNGVLYLLQECVDAVYEECGVYSGRVARWPTFRDVLIKAREREARGREAGWLSSTLRALSSLCFGQMDGLLNTGTNQGLEHLLSKSAILEVDTLSHSDKVFLIQSILLWIHHHRMTEGQRESFKHAIMIEECHHVLSNERRSLIGGQSVMDITFREIREYGESLIILDQHPSKISLSALGNTYCTVCLNLKHAKDVNAMAQSMLLEAGEHDILGSLDVGQAVVKLQGRAVRPFLIIIPEFDIEKGMFADTMVRERMRGIVSMYAAVRDMPASTERGPVDLSSYDQDQSVDRPALAFLSDVQAHPESGVAARYKRLELSVRQGQKLKDKLVEQELIQEHEKRTLIGRLRVIRLTDRGQLLLSEHRQDTDRADSGPNT
jgi:hypothetical protein